MESKKKESKKESTDDFQASIDLANKKIQEKIKSETEEFAKEFELLCKKYNQKLMPTVYIDPVVGVQLSIKQVSSRK